MLAHAPRTPAESLRNFAGRGFRTQFIALAIALLLWSFGGKALTTNLMYSFAIGNCCWLFIDGSIHLVAWLHPGRLGKRRGEGPGWPGLPAMIIIIIVGSVAAYGAGSSLVDWLTGYHSPSLFKSRTSGMVTVLAATAATYFYYTRERLHQEQAAADAARTLALENQLRLLQSQLEPHMLFNTLANLRVLIALDAERAQAMLDRLIAFLRATLNASRVPLHPLAAEFDRLADYLALMEVRMGPRLRVAFDLPADLRTCAVPPLLLQPLVENAIKHGLEPKVEGGRIAVSAKRIGADLHLAVRDTGVGLAAVPGAELPACGLSTAATFATAPPLSTAARSADPAAPSDATTSYGTAHVRARLQALFGLRARFTLQAAVDAEGGTLALIVLPCPAEPTVTPTAA
jgi:hypothetical protein